MIENGKGIQIINREIVGENERTLEEDHKNNNQQ